MKTFNQIRIESQINEAITRTDKIVPGMVVYSKTKKYANAKVKSISGSTATVFNPLTKGNESYPVSDMVFAGFTNGNKVKSTDNVFDGVGSVIGVKKQAIGKDDLIEVRHRPSGEKYEIPEGDLEFVSAF